MTRGQWQAVGFAVALLAAGAGYVYAQPAPNNCGLNMFCRVRTLIVSGDSTFIGRVTLDAGATFNGDVTINGDAGVTGSATIGNDLTVTDDGSFTTVTFAGGGAPCFTRGGNTTVQTCSGDGLAVLSTLQGQGVVDGWDSFKNTGNGANCSGQTAAFCINDPGGWAWTDGSGTTVGVGTVAGLISGDTGVSSGPFSVMWVGGAAVPEGSNGQGGYYPTTIGRGSRFGYVSCGCRVAGSGGTNGVFLSLMADGVEIAEVELSGGASNACDDAAGTLLIGNYDTPFTAAKRYTLQFDSNTDCAGNPTDCNCTVDGRR